jgi:hypothetical protein
LSSNDSIMPGHIIQAQVKLAAMNHFECDILLLADILDIVRFSESTFWCTRSSGEKQDGWRDLKVWHLGAANFSIAMIWTTVLHTRMGWSKVICCLWHRLEHFV